MVLWLAGLGIQEALDLTALDLGPRRGSVLVRRGKRGRRREVGMDHSRSARGVRTSWGRVRTSPGARSPAPGMAATSHAVVRPAGRIGRQAYPPAGGEAWVSNRLGSAKGGGWLFARAGAVGQPDLRSRLVADVLPPRRGPLRASRETSMRM